MQTHSTLLFNKLVEYVKLLPVSQLNKLKAEIEKTSLSEKSNEDLETLLLKGPVATSKQIAVIKNNRRLITKWRSR